jgi:nucleoside-triphosphatase THEP1
MTVHVAARHPLAERVRRAAGENLYVLTLENRDTVPIAIYSLLKKWLGT